MDSPIIGTFTVTSVGGVVGGSVVAAVADVVAVAAAVVAVAEVSIL